MFVKKFKSPFYFIIFSTVLLTLMLLASSVVVVFNISSNINDKINNVLNKSELFWFQLIALGLQLLVVSAGIFLYKRKVINPLNKINNGLIGMKGEFSIKEVMGRYRDVEEIALVIEDVAENVKQNRDKIQCQTAELHEKNWELQEANTELEASYSQLQAIIEQLNEAEQKYHSLVKNIPEIVCVIDNDGMVTFINSICFSMLGYEKSEIVGRNIGELFNGNLAKLSIKDILGKCKVQNSVTIEFELSKKDGKRILTEASFTKYDVNGINMGLQAIIRDITQKREMEEEIYHNNKELATLNSVSKSLTSTLEIENLLTLVVDEITQKLNFQLCVLGMFDSKGISINAKAVSCSFNNEIIDTADFGEINPDSGIIYRVINNNEVIRTSRIPEDWNFGKVLKDREMSQKIQELIIAPINIKNKKIGILIVGSRNLAKTSDINLISSIANSAAVAIDNATLYETTKKYFIKTIDALIAAVEAKDTYTEGHSQRVSKYAISLGEKLQLEKDQIEDIKIAGILHDIGKIGINDNILQKKGKLTFEEYEEIKQHPSISNKILFPVGFSERTLKAIAFHHERFDGKGYPLGLSGKDISIEAQIIAVADAFDAMTSNRSYRDSMSVERATEELIVNKGTQFSPKVVDAMLEVIKELGIEQ